MLEMVVESDYTYRNALCELYAVCTSFNCPYLPLYRTTDTLQSAKTTNSTHISFLHQFLLSPKFNQFVCCTCQRGMVGEQHCSTYPKPASSLYSTSVVYCAACTGLAALTIALCCAALLYLRSINALLFWDWLYPTKATITLVSRGQPFLQEMLQ